jgi:pyruvate carboxylase
MVTSIAVSIGTKVAKGDKLLTLEAMKMQTTLYSPANGVVEEIHMRVGESVESKDLLIRLRT